MGIEIPSISARIGGTMEPLRIVFKQAIDEARSAATGLSKAMDAPIFAAAQSRFGEFEHAVRDGMARTIRSMRDEAKQFNIDQEVKLRLYGPQQSAADVAQAKMAARMIAEAQSGPTLGPAVKPRFDAGEQEIRAGIAARIKAMRDAARSANLEQEINLRLYGPQQQTADVAQAAKAAVEIGKTSAKSGLQGLKGMLGESSMAGLLANAMRGAGPMLAAALIANELNAATGEAKNLVTQFREGNISAGQMVEKIASSVPVFGSIWSAGRNIREMFTHEEESAANLVKKSEDQLKNMNLTVNAAAAIRDIQKQTADLVADTTRQIQKMATLPGSLKGKLFDIDTDQLGKTRSTDDTIEAARKEAKAPIQSRIDELSGERNKAALIDSNPARQRVQVLDEELQKLRAKLPALDAEYDKQKKLQEAELTRMSIVQKVHAAAEAAANAARELASKFKLDLARHPQELADALADVHKQARQIEMSSFDKMIDDFKLLNPQAKELADYILNINRLKIDAIDKELDTFFGAFENNEPKKKTRDQQAFPDFINPNSAEALKLQFSFQRSANNKDQIPEKQLTEAQLQTSLLTQIKNQTQVAVFNGLGGAG
jgi:hypothetical protein